MSDKLETTIFETYRVGDRVLGYIQSVSKLGTNTVAVYNMRTGEKLDSWPTRTNHDMIPYSVDNLMKELNKATENLALAAQDKASLTEIIKKLEAKIVPEKDRQISTMVQDKKYLLQRMEKAQTDLAMLKALYSDLQSENAQMEATLKRAQDRANDAAKDAAEVKPITKQHPLVVAALREKRKVEDQLRKQKGINRRLRMENSLESVKINLELEKEYSSTVSKKLEKANLEVARSHQLQPLQAKKIVINH